MKSKWGVSYNPSAGEHGGYIVYRVINTGEVDHSGNREYGSGYLASKDEAQRIADRLNKAEKEGT